jgi:hypothetical protein
LGRRLHVPSANASVNILPYLYFCSLSDSKVALYILDESQ